MENDLPSRSEVQAIEEAYHEAVKRAFDVLVDNMIAEDVKGPAKFLNAINLFKTARLAALKVLSDGQ